MIVTAPISAQINLYTYRHYDSDDSFKKFTKETEIKINVIKGSADQLIQRMTSGKILLLLQLSMPKISSGKGSRRTAIHKSKTINKNVQVK